MPIDDQVALLRSGVPAWNRARAASAQSGALLIQVDLSDADFSCADLGGVELSAARLTRANLSGAKLARANLSKARLRGANLSGANLSGANLKGADLTETDLSRANLQQADLSKAHLYRSRLSAADLSGAKLNSAYLGETDFSRARLDRTDMSDALLTQCHFSHVDLRLTDGLAAVRHGGPSYVDILTLCCSRGEIPDVFLRGCGVPGQFLAHARSLAWTPVAANSCLISYSSRDQPFAQMLQNDLRARGISCWSVAEDAIMGGNACDRLVQSIRAHENVIVVLSKHSRWDDWVEDEVTLGFEEELRRGMPILLPILLNDAALPDREPWATRVRQRAIGDFAGWQDRDAYQEALAHLLRALRSGLDPSEYPRR